MYALHLFVALSALANLSFGLYTNSSSSTSTATSTKPLYNTNVSCCNVVVNGVGLNFWYNETLEVVNETVVTEYIKYNNTIITTSTTQLANKTYDFPTASTFIRGDIPLTALTDVPSTLVALGEDYQGTILGISTEWSNAYTTM